MAKQQDFEIEIRANGEVIVHMKGVKGKQCLAYSEFFEQMVGRIKEQTLTAEHYEPDSTVSRHIEQKQHRS